MTAADNACSYLHVLSTAMVVKALLGKPFTGLFFAFIKNISHKEKTAAQPMYILTGVFTCPCFSLTPSQEGNVTNFQFSKCCPGIYLLQVKSKVSRIRVCDFRHPLSQSNCGLGKKVAGWCLVKPLACALEAVSAQLM